jgi:hypothetical protein
VTSVIRAVDCRRNADECLRRAQAATSSKLKGHLLSMGRTWMALAVQIERLEQMLDEPPKDNGKP